MQAGVVILFLGFLSVAFAANDATCTNFCLMLQTQSMCTSDFTIGAPGNPTGQALTNCNYWCNQFQFALGNYDNTTKMGDMSNNTIGCRMYYLNKAIQDNMPLDQSANCKIGSITGGGVCGDRCDTYCQILQHGTCYPIYTIGFGSTNFNLNDCQTVCKTFPTVGVDNGAANMTNWGNHVQCRLYHAGIPANGPGSNLIHCAHAAPHGGEACGDRCEGYCQLLLSTCAGHLTPPAVIGSPTTLATCTTACQNFLGFNATLGTYADLTAPEYGGSDLLNSVAYSYGPTDSLGANVSGENSLSCRTYHATSPALASSSVHCPHASFEGGAGCPPDECQVYCDLYFNPICKSFIGSDYADRAACLSTCAAFPKTGDYQSTQYDTLQCRNYHLLVAIQNPTNAATHCVHGRNVSAACSGTAPPPPTAPPTPVAPTAPTPVAPTAPTPVAPTPVAPTPKPKAPTASASGLAIIGFLIPMVLLPLW